MEIKQDGNKIIVTKEKLSEEEMKKELQKMKETVNQLQKTIDILLD